MGGVGSLSYATCVYDTCGFRAVGHTKFALKEVLACSTVSLPAAAHVMYCTAYVSREAFKYMPGTTALPFPFPGEMYLTAAQLFFFFLSSGGCATFCGQESSGTRLTRMKQYGQLQQHSSTAKGRHICTHTIQPRRLKKHCKVPARTTCYFK